MPRKFLKRFLPEHRDLHERWYLRPLKALMQDPGVLHINRRSMCKGFALGIFLGFVPVPMQMLFAVLGAIWLRVNLPMAVASVWITNPVTMPPLYYFCYEVGAWLLGIPESPFHFELSFDWLLTELGAVWKPFLLGSFVLGTISSILAYTLSNAFWTWYVMRQFRRRPAARARAKQGTLD